MRLLVLVDGVGWVVAGAEVLGGVVVTADIELFLLL